MAFPVDRPRRLRRNATIRRLVHETALTPNDFILPLFVVEDVDETYTQQIKSMPDCYHQSPQLAAKTAEQAYKLGVQAVILFGLPAKKDATGSGAWSEDGAVQRSAAEIKSVCPEICVICDTCLCEYTDHGHCGVIKDGSVDNDATIELLAKTALSQARAGADIIAPSDMMDGRVQAIRKALDADGFHETIIMSYAAKFASSFYGPFREAADCAPCFGDRKSYQMDPGNAREAIKEMVLDLDEGADILIVKPALPYLDILRDTRNRFLVPLAAYQVSGEYAQIKYAASVGLVDEVSIMMESLTSIKRAGADMIITYFAMNAARLLIEQMNG
jgi:porphobilinogen synthase